MHSSMHTSWLSGCLAVLHTRKKLCHESFGFVHGSAHTKVGLPIYELLDLVGMFRTVRNAESVKIYNRAGENSLLSVH